MNKRRLSRKIFLAAVILILILAVIYIGLRILESNVFTQGQVSGSDNARKTVIRNGVEYFPRQDVTVILVMGIDQSGPVKASGSYRNQGAADMVMLLIFDEKNEECNILHLNRDTMVNMDVLGIKGEYAGTARGQLALAHTYGSGLEDSCKNVKNTLENFMHGLTIDYYVAMNMDAIPILNDAVGGVTVTVVDDFSMVNPSITMGKMTLRGDQAIDFVRTRKEVGDQKNVTRMERQKEYADNFAKALKQKAHGNIDFMVNVYDKVVPYIVTDCSAEALNGMADRYEDFAIKEILSPEGENVIVDGHYEFHADEEKLDALIMRLFYASKYS